MPGGWEPDKNGIPKTVYVFGREPRRVFGIRAPKRCAIVLGGFTEFLYSFRIYIVCRVGRTDLIFGFFARTDRVRAAAAPWSYEYDAIVLTDDRVDGRVLYDGYSRLCDVIIIVYHFIQPVHHNILLVEHIVMGI